MSYAVRCLIVGVLLCLAVTGLFAQDIASISPTPLATMGQVNIRECAQTSCAVVAKVAKNTALTAIGTTQGQAVKRGNTLWYQATLADGRVGFVYSGVVKAAAAPAPVVESVVVSQPVMTESQAAPAAPASAPAAAFDPNGPDRDCGDFSSHAAAQDFFVAAGGPSSDRHRLDGDNDGIACESL